EALQRLERLRPVPLEREGQRVGVNERGGALGDRGAPGRSLLFEAAAYLTPGPVPRPPSPTSAIAMRTTLLLAVLGLALAATPARAQLGFSPMVGYDIDYEGFMVGLGFELGLTPGLLPIQAAIRPSAEYVFVDNVDLFRINGDLIGRFSPPAAPISPYGKAGVAFEFASINDCEDIPGIDIDCSSTEVGINLGGGVLFNNLFVEGTLGLMDISDFRIAAGYRF